MFEGCTNIRRTNILTDFDTGNVGNVRSMFEGCTNLERLDFPYTFIADSCKDFHFMFRGCINLKNINIDFDMSKAKNISCMFDNCQILEKLTLP